MAVLKTFETCLNLVIVIIKLPEILSNRKQIKHFDANEIHILGNGPSLKNDFGTLKKLLSVNSNVMCVNLFATAKEFIDIQPNYYIISDKKFFADYVDERVTNIQEPTIKALVDRVTWDMVLFVPYSCRNSSKVKRILVNKKIKLQTFSYVPLVGGFEVINIFLFKYLLANPPYQNILIPSIFQAIRLRIKTIHVWGADHSWVENYVVKEDNKIYVRESHFYDLEDEVVNVIENRYGQSAKVHEEFESLAKTFRSYSTLRKLADVLNIKVLNCSSKSWIDSFERVSFKLEE
ncbi:hypothetical protein KDU71_17570 [Carboxylicivirga sediminis]|uniref:DUF115 domain-containing protein n=1 Tax=Carboxylicivirga sediminis TaxID=2006564 RepID=A0A941F5V3_9BACT|nr:hypothetical protein [Carboxylicivirga sediminis]MBR8537381.1 hypothetical protein [Carboxylicivirga sediminis]